MNDRRKQQDSQLITRQLIEVAEKNRRARKPPMTKDEAVIALMDEARRENFPGKGRCARMARAFKTLNFNNAEMIHVARYLDLVDRDGNVSSLLATACKIS